MLGDVTSFNRYVSTSTNAKEFQKRTFFYGQDTWRVTKNLTLNLGLRWEIYFPETVNGPGNGSLLNLNDGYLHVAGIGRFLPIWAGASIWRSSSRLALASPINWMTRRSFAPVMDAALTPAFSDPSSVTPSPRTFRSWPTSRLNSPSTQATHSILAVGPTAYVPITVPANGSAAQPGFAGQFRCTRCSAQLPDDRRLEPCGSTRHYTNPQLDRCLCRKQGNAHAG